MKTTNVAAGVLINDKNEFLLATRPEGKAYAGWWEFPGGKIEEGETPYQAAVREVQEELGVDVTECYPWLTETFVYPHTTVRLQFFQITAWTGTLHPHEGQTFSWHPLGTLEIDHILPANLPILRALALPRQYALTCANEIGEDVLLERLEKRLQAGLRIVQVREKGWDRPRLASFTRAVQARCARYGASVLVNGDPVLAEELGCGVHYTSPQLAELKERFAGLAGASCHTVEDLRRAQDLGLDYAVLGPVKPTASHPGADGMGWDGLRVLLEEGFSIPVYALGGMRSDDLTQARLAGAHGVALMRGAWVE